MESIDGRDGYDGKESPGRKIDIIITLVWLILINSTMYRVRIKYREGVGYDLIRRGGGLSVPYIGNNINYVHIRPNRFPQ